MSIFVSLQSADTKNLSLEEASENLWQLKCMSIGVEVSLYPITRAIVIMT